MPTEASLFRCVSFVVVLCLLCVGRVGCCFVCAVVWLGRVFVVVGLRWLRLSLRAFLRVCVCVGCVALCFACLVWWVLCVRCFVRLCFALVSVLRVAPAARSRLLPCLVCVRFMLFACFRLCGLLLRPPGRGRGPEARSLVFVAGGGRRREACFLIMFLWEAANQVQGRKAAYCAGDVAWANQSTSWNSPKAPRATVLDSGRSQGWGCGPLAAGTGDPAEPATG